MTKNSLFFILTSVSRERNDVKMEKFDRVKIFSSARLNGSAMNAHKGLIYPTESSGVFDRSFPWENSQSFF